MPRKNTTTAKAGTVRQRRYRAKKAAAGICRDCDAPAVTGSPRCSDCTERNRLEKASAKPAFTKALRGKIIRFVMADVRDSIVAEYRAIVADGIPVVHYETALNVSMDGIDWGVDCALLLHTPDHRLGIAQRSRYFDRVTCPECRFNEHYANGQRSDLALNDATHQILPEIRAA